MFCFFPRKENAWVGLRPGRAPLRLESEMVRSVPVVHCYGHGGSGITIGMGCAQDVVVNHVAPLLKLRVPAGGAEPFKPRSKL